jgi:NitT/TauT family transport system permease protein
MNPRRLQLGFIVAAAGMLCPLVLPLSSEAVATLSARPILLALTLAAALLFARTPDLTSRSSRAVRM